MHQLENCQNWSSLRRLHLEQVSKIKFYQLVRFKNNLLPELLMLSLEHKLLEEILSSIESLSHSKA